MSQKEKEEEKKWILKVLGMKNRTEEQERQLVNEFFDLMEKMPDAKMDSVHIREPAPSMGRTTAKMHKKFYKKVTVEQVNDYYHVLLDGNIVTTHAREPLRLPNLHMACAVASEWDSQKDIIIPELMPMMTIASTAQHLGKSEINAKILKLMEYLDNDVVSLRASPSEQATAEAEVWDALVNWFRQEYSTDFHTMSVDELTYTDADNQSVKTREIVRNIIMSGSKWALAAFEEMVESTTSIVISLALSRGAVSVDHALYASRLEAELQQKRWGVVEGAHDVEKHNIRMRLAASSVMLSFAPIYPLENDMKTEEY